MHGDFSVITHYFHGNNTREVKKVLLKSRYVRMLIKNTDNYGIIITDTKK